MRTYLWNAVWVRDDADDVVERQERVTLDLGVDVLALGAAGEQLHEVDVVLERAVGVEAVPLAAHQVDQHREARLVVVEEQHVVAHVQQLQAPTHTPVSSCRHNTRSCARKCNDQQHGKASCVRQLCKAAVTTTYDSCVQVL